jgi:hypothetical protein
VTAFYLPDGDGFVSTDNTVGPWSSAHQHAGPPSALVGRALEAALGPDFFISRVAIDIPRPVPVERLTVEVGEVTGGRRVKRAAAVLRAGEDLVIEARCTAIARSEVELPELPPLSILPPPDPGSLAAAPFPFFKTDVGYHTSMAVRVARGGYGHRETTAWLRATIPLVDGEPWSPLQRVLVAADSGNGVSNVLDPARFVFVNPDLTVCLHREPAGEWICLEAYTTPEPGGVGLAHSRLYDERGPIGHGVQSLLVVARGNG